MAYQNLGNGAIPANANLVFYIELWDFVKDTDHDGDGVPSHAELGTDTTETDPRLIDTDEDRLANYLDRDDDGDGVLSENEDANGNGDLTEGDRWGGRRVGKGGCG